MNSVPCVLCAARRRLLPLGLSSAVVEQRQAVLPPNFQSGRPVIHPGRGSLVEHVPFRYQVETEMVAVARIHGLEHERVRRACRESRRPSRSGFCMGYDHSVPITGDLEPRQWRRHRHVILCTLRVWSVPGSVSACVLITECSLPAHWLKSDSND